MTIHTKILPCFCLLSNCFSVGVASVLVCRSVLVGNPFPSEAFISISGAAKAVSVGDASSGVLGKQFLHHCSCPTTHDLGSRVYGLVILWIA